MVMQYYVYIFLDYVIPVGQLPVKHVCKANFRVLTNFGIEATTDFFLIIRIKLWLSNPWENIF